MEVMTVQELQMLEFSREVLRRHGYAVLVQQLGVVMAREKVLTRIDRTEPQRDVSQRPKDFGKDRRTLTCKEGEIKMREKTVAVVGMGYVGLPTALSLVDHGAQTIGYDLSEGRLVDIKAARVDLPPRDHQRLVNHLGHDLLTLTTEPHALASADAVLICVPTPIDAHQSPDLTALRGACATVVDNARAGQTIILTSTTYVGCTRKLLVQPLADRGLVVGENIFVAFALERIDPGVEDHSPSPTSGRSGRTKECTRHAMDVLCHTASAIHPVAGPEIAEMAKLLENSYRAVNIALANEFAGAAMELGVDIIEVINAAATKPYGFTPFYPGPGVRVHCIPCDPQYLLWQLRERRVHMPLMNTAMTSIALRPREVVSQARFVLAEYGTLTKEARVLVVGVAYKPGVADVRESSCAGNYQRAACRRCAGEFQDAMVEQLAVPEGTLTNLRAPEHGEWDLVILIHPDDRSYNGSPILDTTYRR